VSYPAADRVRCPLCGAAVTDVTRCGGCGAELEGYLALHSRPLAWSDRAAELAAAGQVEEALGWLGAALDLAPQRVELHLMQSRMLGALGRYEEAIEAAEAALELDAGSRKEPQ